jgi:hypothetical protein
MASVWEGEFGYYNVELDWFSKLQFHVIFSCKLQDQVKSVLFLQDGPAARTQVTIT